MTRAWWCVWGLCCGTACGLPAVEAPPELIGRQPFVSKTIPAAEGLITAESPIVLQFSQPLLADSLHAGSVVLLSQLGPEESAASVIEQWENGANTWPLVIELRSERELHLRPQTPLAPGRVAVVVSTAVLSQSGVPLSQSPGTASRPFVAFYQVVSEAAATELGIAMESATGLDLPSELPTGSGDVVVPDATGGAAAASTAVPRPALLLIQEVLYDLPGADTNGELFVELRGTPGGHLDGYQVRFVNGDGGVVTETVVLPAGSVIPPDGLFVIADGMTNNLQATQVANADVVDNFDPQNGPDSVQVLSPEGQVLDVLGYGQPLPAQDQGGQPLYEGASALDASAGASLSRRAEAADTGHNANDFVVNLVPSPGTSEVTEE